MLTPLELYLFILLYGRCTRWDLGVTHNMFRRARNILCATLRSLPFGQDTSLIVLGKRSCANFTDIFIFSFASKPQGKKYVELGSVCHLSVSGGIHHHDAYQAESGGRLSVVHLVNRSAPVSLLPPRRNLPFQQLFVGLHRMRGVIHSRR